MKHEPANTDTRTDRFDPLPQQPMTPEETEAQRNLFAAGQVLRAERTPVDIDAEYRRFMKAHRQQADQPAAPRHPRWLTAVRYALMAAAVIAVAVIILRPKTGGRKAEQTLAKTTPGLVYHADTHPRAVALTRSNGTRVTLPANRQQEVDALDLATTSESLTITIPKGNTYRVKLADGTRVYLNADSRLTFPTTFAGGNRTVELDGEAYFDVAHDPRHPFIVRTQKMETTVLGTEFYIKANPHEQPEVTLISGSVSVTTPRQQLTITPGQQTRIAEDGTQTVTATDIDRYTYWRDGFLYYDNVDLLQVMRDIGRNYNCDVAFLDTSLLHYKIHFVAERSSTIDHILQMLNQMERVRVTKTGNRIEVQ